MADKSALAPEVYYKRSNELRWIAVNMTTRMNSTSAVLTGTPTATAGNKIPTTANAVTIANIDKSAAELSISGNTVPIAGAVTLTVAAGQDGADYEIIVTGASDASPAETVSCVITVKVRD